MTVHTFTIVLDREADGDDLDRLYEAGCDDATFGVEVGLPVATFDREHRTAAGAIASAVFAVEHAGFTALRVIDEDLLTLADVASRIGQSRESIRRYATGERGPGGFPPPINPAREGAMFYRWSEVAPWLRDRLGLDIADEDPTLVAANLTLQARRLRGRVPNMAALADLLAGPS